MIVNVLVPPAATNDIVSGERSRVELEPCWLKVISLVAVLPPSPSAEIVTTKPSLGAVVGLRLTVTLPALVSREKPS